MHVKHSGETMQIGDRVDVNINTGEKVGLGEIIALSDHHDKVSVTVERPRGGPYTFHVPRTWFKPTGEHEWQLDMPEITRTRGLFILPEEQDA